MNFMFVLLFSKTIKNKSNDIKIVLSLKIIFFNETNNVQTLQNQNSFNEI